MKKYLSLTFALFSILSCERPPEVKVYNGPTQSAIINNMLTRRSIRKYTDQQITDAQIDTIMKCAIFAPSANNRQPWEVRVVQNKEWLAEMNKRFIAYGKQHATPDRVATYSQPGYSFFYNAPSLIIIARDKSISYSPIDCGIMLQNILLSSHAIGLGTCPLGAAVPALNAPENSDMIALLNLPEGYEITINAALGYPDEQPPAKERFDEKVKIIK